VPVHPDVARWERVPLRWMGHRAEPLIAERLWGSVLLPPGTDPYDTREAGYDADGRVVAVRGGSLSPSDPDDPDARDAVVHRSAREVVVEEEITGDVARTTLDADGRPVRTDYDMGGAEEYRYEDGVLVELDESPELWDSVFGATRDWTGGTLTVGHDEDGPVRIVTVESPYGAGEIVWRRPEADWDVLLERYARRIADRAVEIVAERCAARAVAPTTEVFSLVIWFSGQGGPDGALTFGREDARRRWVDAAGAWTGSNWSIWRPFGGTDDLLDMSEEDRIVPDDLERAAFSGAAMHDPADPHVVVLDAAAALLARHDWSGLVRTTPDFVVYTAGHDRDTETQLASVRRVNPAERVALWELGPGPGAA
jgi:hypothetical protein